MKYQKFAVFFGSTVLAIGSINIAVAADASPTATNVTQSTPESTLSEIVVTAERVSTSAQNVPISLTVFSTADLTRHSINTIAELQSQTPGLTLRGSTTDVASPLISMRGQSQTRNDLGKQPNVAIYYDDVYRPNGTGAVTPAALFDVERVEVLRGPQGTLFGRNTTGGAISVHSKMPTSEYEGLVQAGVGDYGTYSVNGMANVPLSGADVALRVVGSYVNTDGYGSNLTTNRPNGGETYATRATLLAQVTDRLKFVLRGDFMKSDTGSYAYRIVGLTPGSSAVKVAATELGLGTGPAALATAYNAILASYPSNKYDYYGTPGNQTFSHVKSAGGTLEVAYDLTDTLQLKSITAYRHQDAGVAQDAEGSPFYILAATATAGTFLKQGTQEIQLNGSLFDDRLRIASGIYYFDLTGDDIGNSAAVVPIGGTITHNINHVENTSRSAYGQLTYSLTDLFKVTGGLRYTSEDFNLTSSSYSDAAGCVVALIYRINGQCLGRFPNHYNNFSYLAGVDYSPSKNVLLYAKVARGFKAGGQNTSGTLNPGSYTPFKPELATNIEGGIKADWLNRTLRTNLSVYQVNYSDIQRSIIVPFPPFGVTNIVQNAGKGRIRGVEAEVTVQPVDRLTLGGSLAYTNAKYLTYVNGSGADLSANHFPSTPKWQETVSINYKLPLANGSLDFTLDGYAQSYIDYDPDNHTATTNGAAQQNAYALANGRILWTIKSADLSVSLYGKNLTDRRYNAGGYDTTGSLGFAVNTYGPPRTYGIDVTKKF